MGLALSRYALIAAMVIAVPGSAQDRPASSVPPLSSSPPAKSLPGLPVTRSSSFFDDTGPIANNTLSTTFASSREYSARYDRALIVGRCLARAQPRLSRQLLDAQVNSPEERSLLNNSPLSSRACFGGGGGFSVIFLRGAIAEALVKGDAALPGRPNSPEASRLAEDSAYRGQLALADDRRFTTIATCIAAKSPQETRAVLATGAGSRKEVEALDRALASAPTCTTLTRLPANTGPSFLRSYLAVAAYHVAQAERPRNANDG